MSTEQLSQPQWQALEISPDAIVLSNKAGVIVYFNQKAERLFGYPKEEILGKKIESLIPTEYRKTHVTHRKNFMSDPRSYCLDQMREVTALRKDGLEIPVDITLFHFDSSDGVMVCAAVRDASLRLERDEALQSSQARFKELIETMNEGFGEVDHNYIFTYVNPRFCEMLGYTSKEMVGKPLIGFVHDDDKKKMNNQIALRKQGVEKRHEMSFKSKNGDRIYVLSSPKAEFDENKNFISAFGVLTDLTELKQDERALKESELRYRILVETIPHGIQESDLEGIITLSNRAHGAMHGYDMGELLGKKIWDIFPINEERERLRDYYFYIIEHRPTPVPYLTQDRTKGGRIIDVQVDWDYQYTEDGDLTGFVSVITDITERKKAEEQLKLASLVFENSSEGMVVTDEENQIITINPAFSNITGYKLSEVLGKNPSMFKSGRHDSAFYKAMWHELTTTGHWQGEIWDKLKNGGLHAKWLTINTILNQDGSIRRYVALFSDITERKHSEELIWRQANFDSLTELPNRNMFRDRLAQEIIKSNRLNLSLALLLIDLDEFKEVNDTLGHDVGDTLLKEATRRIRKCVRDSDTVARLGGDEFTIILSELPANSNVEDIANKIITSLAEAYHLGDEVIHVSASIGITIYPDDATDIDVLIKNADQAMYAAKKNGRNRFSYFTQSLQDAARTRLQIANDLRGALGANQFRLYFQPILDLATGSIYKAEALLRWQHPRLGLIGPGDFIVLAEETGLINEIGNWVFKESARWAKRWSDQFESDFKVSVNMSPVQFRVEGEHFAAEWLRHLKKLKLSGKNIIIEITEGLLLKAEDDIMNKILNLRAAGIQVAIDDFGTGYSSLSYIKKFDIDFLKIDQTFVQNLEADSNDMALSEAIIVMAHKLGIKVIAEGVETEEQQKLLADAGCDFSQGYLYSKPVPPEEFEALLQAK